MKQKKPSPPRAPSEREEIITPIIVEFQADKPHAMMRCPFCAGVYEVGYLPDGRPGLTHTLPTCEKFDKDTLLDFLRAARLAGAYRIDGSSEPSELSAGDTWPIDRRNLN